MMFQWIAENVGTILISLLVVLLAAAAVITLRRDRKKGKSACGCRCGSCPMAGTCHGHPAGDP